MSENHHHVIDNLTAAQLPADDRTVKAVFQGTAKDGLELPVTFFRRPGRIETPFKAVYGQKRVQVALDMGEGLLFITSRIDSYNLARCYISQQLPFPLIAMYKSLKFKMMDAVVQVGRVRGKGKTAPTSMQGIKQATKTSHAGEIITVLPDHVPSPEEGGDGVRTEFLGKPVYTMTLTGKLAQVRGMKVLFFCGKCLPDDQGLALHIGPSRGELSGDREYDVWIANESTEYWIRRFPTQHLFTYNHYKHPAGAPLPPQR